MVKTPISMDMVILRKNYLLDSRDATNLYGLYENTMLAIKNNRSNDIIRPLAEDFISKTSTKENMKIYLEESLNILSSLSNYNIIQKSLYNRFINDSIYYHPDMKSLKEQVIKSDIDNETKSIIIDRANYIKTADNILENHTKLSKRFNIDSIYNRKNISFEKLTNIVCEMVDTYNIKPYVKLELVLQEMSYKLQSLYKQYDEQCLVEHVIDYFLSRDCNTKEDIESYKDMLNRSKIISESSCDKIKYLFGVNESIGGILFEDSGIDSDIQKLINQYKIDEQKSDTKLRSVLNRIFTKDPALIIDDMPDIFRWVRNFGVIVASAISVPAGLVALMTNALLKSNLEKDRMKKVIKYFNSERNTIEDKMFEEDDDDKRDRLENYLGALDSSIEKLKEYENSLYSDDANMERDSDYDMEDIDESYSSLKDNKIKLNNLITDAEETSKLFDKYANDKISSYNAKKNNVKDALTESNLLSYINEYGTIDMVLCSYDITNVDDIYKFTETVENIVFSINNMIHNKSGKIYFMLGELSLDICYMSKCKYPTTLHEDALSENNITDANMILLYNINESLNNLQSMEESYLPEIMNFINKTISGEDKRIFNIGKPNLSTIIETWSTYGVDFIDEADMRSIVKIYNTALREYGDYYSAGEIDRLLESNVRSFISNNDVKTKITGSNMMYEIIVNEGGDVLNSLKLAMMSFKKKVGDLNAKQKEMSRDLDVNFNHFIKSIKDSDNTDRREQIIRGQVCPSLSKMIKIGIALTIAGVATGTVLLPAIAAVGGLARSKHLNHKERKLILDEIDVELKVLEKEIRKAEDGGSTKKYRNLLMYKKKLQNERTRILLNLKKNNQLVGNVKGGGDE